MTPRVFVQIVNGRVVGDLVVDRPDAFDVAGLGVEITGHPQWTAPGSLNGATRQPNGTFVLPVRQPAVDRLALVESAMSRIEAALAAIASRLST